MNSEIKTKVDDFIEALKLNKEFFDSHEMKFNFFKILGKERSETVHSKFLAYFLNPKENHNLGDKFIKLFIQSIDLEQKLEYGDFEVSTEKPYRIDIFIKNKNNKYIVVIENKIDADESDKETSTEEINEDSDDKFQLKRYKKNIEDDRNFKDYIKKFIFLTPDGRSPNDPEDSKVWSSMSYEDIKEMFKKILSEKIEPNIRTVIEWYVELLEKEIVINNDTKVKCQQIYDENKDAIEFIMKNKDDVMVRKIKELYAEIQNEKPNFCLPNKSKATKFIEFRTKLLIKTFDGKEENCLFTVVGNCLRLYYTKENKEKAQKYCDIFKNKSGFKFTSLKVDIDKFDEDTLIDDLRAKIYEILELEEEYEKSNH